MTTPTTSPIDVEDRGTVRWIWFNRPDVHNAQNVEMLELLDDVLIETDRDQDVRVVVVAGRGRSFCSGHDLKEMAVNKQYRLNSSTAEGRYWQEERLFSRPVERLRTLRVPTISRVQGHCLAAGLMFVATTDFAVAAPDAVFGSRIIPTIGVNDAELPAFSWLVGERRAKQALWLGEEVTAEEALRIGLVNWVVSHDDLDAKVEELAERLSRVPREVLAFSKASFEFTANMQGRRDAFEYHYLSHQFTHQTREAQDLLEARLDRARSGASIVAPEQRFR